MDEQPDRLAVHAGAASQTQLEVPLISYFSLSLNGRHESEQQTLGDGEGQESLVCCSPRRCRESDITQRLNNSDKGWGPDSTELVAL